MRKVTVLGTILLHLQSVSISANAYHFKYGLSYEIPFPVHNVIEIIAHDKC